MSQGVHSGWADAGGDAVAVATSPHSVGGHSRSVRSLLQMLLRFAAAFVRLTHLGLMVQQVAVLSNSQSVRSRVV
jgi:hypothetical protein